LDRRELLAVLPAAPFQLSHPLEVAGDLFLGFTPSDVVRQLSRFELSDTGGKVRGLVAELRKVAAAVQESCQKAQNDLWMVGVASMQQ